MSRPAETAKVSHTREGRTSFVPTPVDVIVARAMLRKSGALPFELTNRIIEFAEYWPCSHTSITYEEAAIFGRDSNKLLVSRHSFPRRLRSLSVTSDPDPACRFHAAADRALHNGR